MRYRLQRHDGTDCSATMVPITVLRMVPIQRYRQNAEKRILSSKKVVFAQTLGSLLLLLGLFLFLSCKEKTIPKLYFRFFSRKAQLLPTKSDYYTFSNML